MSYTIESKRGYYIAINDMGEVIGTGDNYHEAETEAEEYIEKWNK